MSKHTPGPWKCEEHVIVDEDGQQVASVLPFYDEKEAESLADARLIAAAPELLAACKTLADYVANLEGGNGRDYGIVKVARAAIARAEGNQ